MRRHKVFTRRDVLGFASQVGLAGLIPTVGYASRFPHLVVLDADQARKLLSVSRTLFPHDFLDDDYYINVVVAIDTKAARDPVDLKTLIDGLRKVPSEFIVMGEVDREAYLHDIDKSPFFSLAYNETLNGLYGNTEVSRLLGYSEVHTGNMAINSATYDGRPGCQQIGFCTSGCVIGAR